MLVFGMLIFSAASELKAQFEISKGITVNGYIRYRMELDGRDFNSNTGMDNYSTLRTRLGIQFDNLVENTIMVIEIGDSRTMGYSDPYFTGSNIGPNKLDNNLGIIQAYISIKDILKKDVTLFYRQEGI